MKKLFLLTLLCIASLQSTWAKLAITEDSNGTVIFTLEASNDIANEFTNTAYATYQASAFITPYLNKTKLKIVTKPGVTMSSEDLKRICGMAEEENNFPNLNTLDLEFANFTNDNDLVNLKYMDNLKTITFPRTTTNIPQQCLTTASCKIEHVIIPDNDSRSVKIGAQAFGESLKTIKLGEVDKNGNSEILQYAFERCTNLTSVDFGTGWKEIGTNAFFGCSALKDIVLPEGVEYIRNGAFNGAAIEAIHLPNTLKVIEKNAFVCEKLKTITIPASVEEIEKFAFQNNKALTDVYVLGTNTKAENQAFGPYTVSNFKYDNPGNITPVKREFYTNQETGKLFTMLHYPEAAYENYVNENSRSIGGSTQNVVAENGGCWPTFEDGKFSLTSGDYAGWRNFALTGKLKQEETWEDTKRVDGKWYTMCLPFDMTAQQLKSAYGSKVEVVEFSGVDVEEKTNHDKIITLKFKQPVTETKAHHPYMIHPSLHKGTTTGVKTTIVGITKQEEKLESLESQKVVKEANGVTYTFIGNYDNTKTLQQYSYYYYSGDDETTYKNGFYKWIAPNSGTWTPYTACVLMNKDNGANAKPAISYYLENFDGETTAIGTLPTIALPHKQEDKIYTIMGQEIQQGTLNLKTLPKGVYISNGKKYIVR
jgi:cell surface protein